MALPRALPGAGASPGVGFDGVFRRRLSYLGYFDTNGFSAQDSKKFRSVVVWLEDQRIRHWSPERRSNLRNLSASRDDWDRAFEEYLTALQCPLDLHTSKNTRLVWLLGRAVELEFTEKLDQIEEAERKQKQSPGKKESNVDNAGDPLTGVDLGSTKFREAVNQLAVTLKIIPHPSEPKITLLACCAYLNRLDDQVNVKTSPRDGGKKKGQKKSMQRVHLEDHTMNVAKQHRADEGLYQALKILQLLKVQRLRDLQDTVNATIESVQKLTADPKTDTRLGKVGR